MIDGVWYAYTEAAHGIRYEFYVWNRCFASGVCDTLDQMWELFGDLKSAAEATCQ